MHQETGPLCLQTQEVSNWLYCIYTYCLLTLNLAQQQQNQANSIAEQSAATQMAAADVARRQRLGLPDLHPAQGASQFLGQPQGQAPGLAFQAPQPNPQQIAWDYNALTGVYTARTGPLAGQTQMHPPQDVWIYNPQGWPGRNGQHWWLNPSNGPHHYN
jgi:hypothetical protein